jgi:predicted glycogen debranching enzyme
VARATPPADPRLAFEPFQVRFDDKICGDLTRASKKEWLLTNGLGGYAMSTIAGLNTRRYHGLLVAAMRSPVGRAVVLSKMDEIVELPTGPLALDTNFYPGVVHPRGFEHIENFTLYPFPTVHFAGPGWRLSKTVHLVHGENTVVVTYRMLPAFKPRRTAKKSKSGRGAAESDHELIDPTAPARRDLLAGVFGGQEAATRETMPPPPLEAPAIEAVKSDSDSPPAGAAEFRALEALRLRVRPLFAFRDTHALSAVNDRIERSFGVRSHEGRGTIVRCVPYPEWEPVYLVCREAAFVESAEWYKNFEYPQERYRGLDFKEDLWSYGYFEGELRVGDSLAVVCTLHAPEKRAPVWPVEIEIERRRQVSGAGEERPFLRQLHLAADQFLVRRDRDLTSIVAGYPWFTDRSRETLMAVPGLLLVTGRFREAKAVLRTYARALDRGMLPNRMPDTGERSEYGSVDATLWLFIALFKYLQYTGDFDFVKTELRIPLLETIRYYEEGTRYGIRVESDGLLRCGEPGRALTWMDARAGDEPVTPRHGKPVEVNALWYNALKIMERLAERFSIPSDMARFARMAEKIEDSFFATFWNAGAGCLHDVVDYAGPDAAIRPNQILAVSLPFPLLDSESAQSVVRVVGAKLLTPNGLRTLDPEHPNYRGVYDGDAKQRNAALHQGTAWSWLLGPYVSALVKANGAAGRAEATKLLQHFEVHALEDGLGQVSELFWGNAPHWPRGCPASTVAVAEILRASVEDVLGRVPGRQPAVHEPVLRRR